MKGRDVIFIIFAMVLSAFAAELSVVTEDKIDNGCLICLPIFSGLGGIIGTIGAIGNVIIEAIKEK